MPSLLWDYPRVDGTDKLSPAMGFPFGSKITGVSVYGRPRSLIASPRSLPATKTDLAGSLANEQLLVGSSQKGA